MLIEEQHTNETENHFLCEPITEETELSTGEVFRGYLSNGWRCQSSVYVDTKDGKTKRIGWYFVKRERYEDTGEAYLRGCWVTLLEKIIPAKRISLDLSA